jgi:hypothetical protein
MAATVQTFTTNQTWTCPTGVTSLIVELWGGGGTGGGARGTGCYAGGGAGGQYAIKSGIAVTPGQNYALVVAAAATASASAQVNGNDSTWATNVVVAKGGAGGALSTTSGTTSAGGVGSTASGVGDTVYAGGSGATGVASTRSGGGGSGAGSTGTGNNASASAVTGGVAKSENGGAGGNGVSSNNTRNAGSSYGAGGSGGCATGTTDYSGGNGAAGFARLTFNITPALTTNSCTSILPTSATANGDITCIGESNATRRGFCYFQGASGTPTVADSVVYADGSFGTGAYAGSLTALTHGTAYRVRAYATNGETTYYGAVVDLVTAVDAPTVTTQYCSSITPFSAIANGTIPDNGGGTITRRGICFTSGTTETPTISDNPAYEDGSFGAGAYTISLPSLTPANNYRVRAYAINSAGTSYGSTIQLTTPDVVLINSLNSGLKKESDGFSLLAGNVRRKLTLTGGNANLAGQGDALITLPLTAGTLMLTTDTAAKATVLETPRAINGVNFDGSAPITISAAASDVYAWAKASVKPTYTYSEVGAAPASTVSFPGFGNTSALACSGDDGRLSDARTANGGNSATCSGLAGSATILATARAINGVDFNGSAAISVPSNITPGTSGNVLTSNGSLWTSAAPAIANLPVNSISGNTTASVKNIYVLTASLVLTLPASAVPGDVIKVSNLSGTTTSSIARNGHKIMNLAEDMTIDKLNIGLELIYINATLGWVII